MKRPDIFDIELTDEEFELFRTILESETGIVLKPSKRQLLKNRLRPLLVASGKNRYLELLHGLENATERFIVLSTIIDAITTNLTEFFREDHQFEVMTERVFPELCGLMDDGVLEQAMLWSAGCSTGQEAYSLGMVLRETVPRRLQKRFRLLATDIDSSALSRARRGRYTEEELEGVSTDRRKQHLVRTPEGEFQITEKLQSLIRFTPRNLIQPHTWGPGRYHVIFCRNVLIYFSGARREKILQVFTDSLHPGGYLFLGHAEGIQRRDKSLEFLGPSTYRKLR